MVCKIKTLEVDDKMSDDEDFEKMYPKLNRELREGRTVRLEIRRDMGTESDAKETARKIVKHFTPAITDFIRRCDNIEQAMEIVDYMLKRQEISETEARRIKTQLKENGLRSFGSKKEADHYLKYGIDR